MSDLVLDSLEIKNFRAFKHLRIEHLGRVNLIVGKNNVGKSSVLEALWLYSVQGEPDILLRILQRRNVIKRRDISEPVDEATLLDDRLSSLRYLFYNYPDVKRDQRDSRSIQFGPVSSEENAIRVTVCYIVREEGHFSAKFREIRPSDDILSANVFYGLAIHIGLNPPTYVMLQNNILPRYLKDWHGLEPVNCFQLWSEGLTSDMTALLWDSIALTDAQGDVIAAMQIIAPGLMAINFVAGQGSGRIPIAKIANIEIPVPLLSLGEGMSRMFGIILALVNAKDGILLIDEVDTGLHYSVLPDLWKLIFEVAHRLNVQVFATSHSWDCIQAFQLAADDNKEEEGVVIRLENRDGEVSPIIFDERKLNIAVREHIEVR